MSSYHLKAHRGQLFQFDHIGVVHDTDGHCLLLCLGTSYGQGNRCEQGERVTLH